MAAGNRQMAFCTLESSVLIAVARSDHAEPLLHAAEILAEEGIRAVEVTFTVPGALQVIERLSQQLGETTLIGAGTVLDAATARLAILAGARFIVSPILDPELVAMCHRYDTLVIPGAFTPTEIMSAWKLGVDAVKVFPADVGGPSYLRALHGPLPHVRLVPTGGVTPETAPAFLEAGAWCLAAGGALLPPAALRAEDWDEVRARARAFRAAVRRWVSDERNQSP